ncbi:response regulator [Polaromonas sp. P1-6]|nr:response regulator [Polaromonas sp. P1-6]
MLEQQGYEVAVADNGRVALEMAVQFLPALIISDVVMPEMDGYELSRRIKEDAGLCDIPVILVTTMSDPQDVILGLECCADNLVLKPYDERYSQLLAQDSASTLSSEARRHLKVITESSRQMDQLIDDLLEFSRMGRAEMRESSVDPNDLVQQTIRTLDMASQGRSIAWRIAPLPPVLGDAAMLRQVFANLLGNAVKYTRPREAAEIEIGSAVAEDGRLVVFVRDNGVGFDMQYADKLFGVFQRLHRADEFEGTGIGLASVRRIIERDGGRVWAESQPGEGATFYFSLSPERRQPGTPASP